MSSRGAWLAPDGGTARDRATQHIFRLCVSVFTVHYSSGRGCTVAVVGVRACVSCVSCVSVPAARTSSVIPYADFLQPYKTAFFLFAPCWQGCNARSVARRGRVARACGEDAAGRGRVPRLRLHRHVMLFASEPDAARWARGVRSRQLADAATTIRLFANDCLLPCSNRAPHLRPEVAATSGLAGSASSVRECPAARTPRERSSW